MSVYPIALSGLNAQATAVGAYAQNIANIGSIGKTAPQKGDRQSYIPVDVVSISQENGGVKTQVQPRDPGTVTVYNPDSVDADQNGFIAAPDMSLEENILGLNEAKNAYAANAKVLRVQDSMDKALLDIIS